MIRLVRSRLGGSHHASWCWGFWHGWPVLPLWCRSGCFTRSDPRVSAGVGAARRGYVDLLRAGASCRRGSGGRPQRVNWYVRHTDLDAMSTGSSLNHCAWAVSGRLSLTRSAPRSIRGAGGTIQARTSRRAVRAIPLWGAPESAGGSTLSELQSLIAQSADQGIHKDVWVILRIAPLWRA